MSLRVSRPFARACTQRGGRRSSGICSDRSLSHRAAGKRHAIVEMEIVEDRRAIAELCEYARARRFLIACDRCHDPLAQLVAMVWPHRQPSAVLAFCASCYRRFSAMALD
jgi:hypothetical protein